MAVVDNNLFLNVKPSTFEYKLYVGTVVFPLSSTATAAVVLVVLVVLVAVGCTLLIRHRHPHSVYIA